jgi:hypothetical protein
MEIHDVDQDQNCRSRGCRPYRHRQRRVHRHVRAKPIASTTAGAAARACLAPPSSAARSPPAIPIPTAISAATGFASSTPSATTSAPCVAVTDRSTRFDPPRFPPNRSQRLIAPGAGFHSKTPWIVNPASDTGASSTPVSHRTRPGFPTRAGHALRDTRLRHLAVLHRRHCMMPSDGSSGFADCHLQISCNKRVIDHQAAGRS